MPIPIDLPPELEAAARTEAAKRGIPVEQLVLQGLINQLPPEACPGTIRGLYRQWFAEWKARQEQEAGDEEGDTEADFCDMVNSMNADRAGGRLLFPPRVEGQDVVKVVVLDSTPLWLLARPASAAAPACVAWASALLTAGHLVVIPEIVDYEVRREMVRQSANRQLQELNGLRSRMAYAPLTTPVMRRAADWWAFARSLGQPTAGGRAIDADMILVAQAEAIADPNTVIATSNVAHLARFFPAELWPNIAP